MHINIRYVPEGVSKAATKALHSTDSISNEPTLSFEFRGGDEEGEIVTFTPEKRFTLGRQDDRDLQITYGAVSRVHGEFFYDPEDGWMITEDPARPSAAGTWLHPKSYFSARIDTSNSLPVILQDGMLIKACTYLFEFTYQK